MVRRALLPDFRCVWLRPARRFPFGVAPSGLTVTLLGCGGMQLSAHRLAFAAVTVVGFLMLAVPPLLRENAKAAMVVLPWGVIVDPDGDPRVFHWPGIDEVRVAERHRKDEGTPVVVETHVTVKARGRGSWSGVAAGTAGLEGLTVHLAAYAAEASRAIGLDLDLNPDLNLGREEQAIDRTEPVVSRLLQAGRELVSSSRGAAQLALPSGGYRAAATPTATSETLVLLRDILRDEPADATRADLRPLASVLAALLDARTLVPDLLPLTNAPHPVVAAVARASARLLGAPQSRAGAIDEVASFLFEDDEADLLRWLGATEPSPVRAGGQS